jgi:coenzyme F420-0:L-glutamate ligase/coenzyme F420-1:gamma-L-glutamate ligase
MTPPVAPRGSAPDRITVQAVDGIGEVTPGTDLAALVADHALLADGDVVVVTSKIVSKAEGRVVELDREDAITRETVRVVARRGGTRIVENRLGLVMAAAGVDGSNVSSGSVVLLPEDPDRSARELRRELLRRTGCNVAVVVSDTAGRAWRNGQTDIAIGLAGMAPLDEFAGEVDAHGNTLAVTAPAVADEVTGIAEVASGKLGGRPVVVLRGLAARVLPPGTDGPGATALQRDRSSDMFALGAREAVVAALAGEEAESFGAPATADEVLAALRRCGYDASLVDEGIRADAAASDRVLAALLHAHRWRALSRRTGRSGPESGEVHSLLAPLP